jgi:hypothetical protein
MRNRTRVRNRVSCTGQKERALLRADMLQGGRGRRPWRAAPAVLASYRAFWDDMIAVGATINWRSPRMDDHATGNALAQAQATHRLLRQRGLVARGTVTLRVAEAQTVN